MNSSQINDILCRFCHNFGGVFPANRFDKMANSSFYILNTDNEWGRGIHWVSFYINNRICEFFDSMGKPPSYYYPEWHEFLIEKSGIYVYNDLGFQSKNSNICGEYCILYIILRSHGVDLGTLIEYLERINFEQTIKQEINILLTSTYNRCNAMELMTKKMY